MDRVMVVNLSLSRAALFNQMAAMKMFQQMGVRTEKQARICCTRDHLMVPAQQRKVMMLNL